MTKPDEGRSCGALGGLLFRLYPLCRGSIRRAILRLVLKLEGGAEYSRTIRRIFSEHHRIDVGMYSDIGVSTALMFASGTKIGRYTSIYPSVRHFHANHPMNVKSTHAFFYNPVLGYCTEDIVERTDLEIGNDVFIGHNVTILNEVQSIGDGAVLGAGSVVHRDVPPYAVVVGNPSRIIRRRFSDETIEKLLEEKWWERPMTELASELEEFRRPVEGSEIVR